MDTYNAVLAALLMGGPGHKGWVCVEQTLDWADYEFDFGKAENKKVVLVLSVFKYDHAVLKIFELDFDGNTIDESNEFVVNGELARQMTQHTFN